MVLVSSVLLHAVAALEYGLNYYACVLGTDPTFLAVGDWTIQFRFYHSKVGSRSFYC